MEDILYINSATDVRIKEMVEIIPDKDKELPNLIILTILSAGARAGTPIFSVDPTMVGTKFILDGEEITSDIFNTIIIGVSGTNYNFYGLYFLDSGEHTLKISLIAPKITNFQRITGRKGYSANSITSVIISSSITEISDGAFSGCTSLTLVTIPNSVTVIGSRAFEGCSGLTSIYVASDNLNYDSRNNCNSIIETKTNTLIAGCKNTIIPNSVTQIGDYAFWGCRGLTQVTIPNSVAKIGVWAFRDCSGLTLVTIPNSVTEIGKWAFAGCCGLTQVTIGNSVTSIGNSAFEGCSGLTSITSLAATAPTITTGTFQNIKTNGTLHVPAGSDYSTWMLSSNYYLGLYNWTKVEDA